MCEVSIIIPNWNGGDVLGECLESILEHTRNVSFELIVIDNGSGDSSHGTIEALAQRDERVKAIFNKENLFFAKACNQGYEMSHGRFILIANNDILLEDDAVSALASYLDLHPEVAVVSPRFVGRDGQPHEFYRRLPNAAFVLAHYHLLGRILDRLAFGRRLQHRYFYRDRSFAGVEEIEQPGASFSLFRRTVIESVGVLFDEQYPLLFNDVDLSFRLRQHGAISHVNPAIRVVHLEGVSSAQLDPDLYRRFQFVGLFAYFRRYHRWQYPILCLAWPRWWMAHR